MFQFLEYTTFVHKKANMTLKQITVVMPANYSWDENGNPLPFNKVQVIKAIRALTQYGLTQSKTVSENTNQQTLNINTYSITNVTEKIGILKANGVKVTSPVYEIIESLRKLANDALHQGEDDLANEILQLVLVEKLRRKDLTPI